MEKMLFAMVAVLLVSMNAQAANLWCTGTVPNIYIDNGGSVTFKSTWRNDYTVACNINVSYGGGSVETCRGWLSMLMTANVAVSP